MTLYSENKLYFSLKNYSYYFDMTIMNLLYLHLLKMTAVGTTHKLCHILFE